MKKFIVGVLFAAILLVGGAALGANGDVAGNIYSTDILAFVNGEPIDGYNIGGRTVIIAEDLNEYGFYCTYNDENRTLNIVSYFSGTGNDFADIPRGKVGTVLGNIYETDIKVYLNGIEIQGYNIGGRTAICIEDMGEVTDSPNAKYGYSKYLGKTVWNEQERAVSFESFKINQDKVMGMLARVSYTFLDNVLYAYSDEASKSLEIRPVKENPAFSESSFEGVENNYSKGFKKDALSPLYIDVNGEKTQVGLAAGNPNDEYGVLMHFYDVQEVLSLTSKAKAPKKGYAETVKYFSEKYEIVNRLDNDKYTVLHIDDEKDGVLFVYINKNGGYIIDDFLKNFGDSEVKIWFNENEENTVSHSVYPFAGPHGADTMKYESQLDFYDYE